jgi:hypothetical protein
MNSAYIYVSDSAPMVRLQILRNQNMQNLLIERNKLIDEEIKFLKKVKNINQAKVKIMKSMDSIYKQQIYVFSNEREIKIHNMVNAISKNPLVMAKYDEHEKNKQNINNTINYFAHVVTEIGKKIPDAGVVTNAKIRTVI